MFNAKHDKAGKRLIITASNEGRAALAECYRRAERPNACSGHYYAESELMEAFRDYYEIVAADDAPDAWLCSCPFIIDADGIEYPDNGERPVLWGTPMFAFPNYALEDEWETLKNTGRVIFEEVEWNDTPPPPLTKAEIESHFTGGAREGFLLYVDPVRFPDATEEQIASAWPELARSLDYEPDRVDCGLYFWKRGKRFGPYSTSPRGVCNAERDGCRGVFDRTPEPTPDPELPFAEAA
jgi:hypothetical protein